jgi:hypothetical protein
MASVDIITSGTATAFTAGSVVLAGYVSSIVMQKYFDTRYRDLPDEDLTTQFAGVAFALVAVSVGLNLGGLVWAELFL